MAKVTVGGKAGRARESQRARERERGSVHFIISFSSFGWPRPARPAGRLFCPRTYHILLSACTRQSWAFCHSECETCGRVVAFIINAAVCFRVSPRYPARGIYHRDIPRCIPWLFSTFSHGTGLIKLSRGVWIISLIIRLRRGNFNIASSRDLIFRECGVDVEKWMDISYAEPRYTRNFMLVLLKVIVASRRKLDNWLCFKIALLSK